jgi:hypothetical protein
MPSRRTSLALQELGERIVPSTSAVEPIVHPIVAAASANNHPLHGTGSGRYHTPTVTIDAGTSFTLTGTANLGTLGKFNIVGSMQGIGMIVNGRATGNLVLANSRGMITLKLHGPIQPAFSSIPHGLVYVVSKGTDDFQHLTGYGSLEIKLTPFGPTALGKSSTGAIAMTFS